MVGQCCSKHTVSIQSPYSRHTVDIQSICSLTSVRRVVSVRSVMKHETKKRDFAESWQDRKRKPNRLRKKNLQSKKEIEMIQHNYEVISRYFHAMVHSMRQAKIRDLRGAPGPREAGPGRQGGREPEGQGGREAGVSTIMATS